MKKKSILLAATAVMLVCAMSIGGMLAYFTDTDTKENTFTVGNVEIVVNEEFEQGSIANPGVAVAKNPSIENTGGNDAYVRMKVVLSDGLAWMTAIEKNYGEEFDLATVFGGHNADNWSRVDYAGGPAEYDFATDTLTYTYNYVASALKPDESTDSLFTSVTMPAPFDNEDVAGFGADGEPGFTITIIGEAIQAEGFESAEEALSTLAEVGADPAVEP